MPGLLHSVMDYMVVLKYRRAPFGGGRFWQQARETISLLLDNIRDLALHPVVQSFVPGLARDAGLPAEDFDSPGTIAQVLAVLVNSPIGPRVEMRRWWTFYDAVEHMDKLWHALALALVVEFLLAGEDPPGALVHTCYPWPPRH